MRSLHIYCDGGFGNRFNALVSGLALAQKTGLTPVVAWPRNNWCGASFSTLLTNPLTVNELEVTTYLQDKETFHFFSTEDAHLKFGVPNQSPLHTPTLDGAIAHIQASEKNVFFSTPLVPNFLPWDDVRDQVAALHFSPAIVERMQNFLQAQQLDDFFGLQIRKTDFGSNGADDDNLFNLVTNCPQKRFFVCSDDKDVEERFMQLPNVAIYPKRAHVEKLVAGGWNSSINDHSGRVYACNVNRNEASVEDALVDLLILSHSQIVRTSNSTFLNTALLLKQVRAESIVPSPS